FGEQGYSATTMRNIAEQSGIEAASIYYHFASKEELVDEVMEQGGNRIISQQQERLR
ncbi:helix-turn-helix domain-containing protein, partial [Escherichia coli]|uniref:helix-turn-helix domain-containing protein n=1 Tax=Escherichia coli TaxID=562 RepID=UPI00259CB5B7